MSDGWSDDRGRRGRRGTRDGGDRGTLVLGALLVLVGIAFLFSNQLHVDLGHYGWPLWVIVPGVALLLLGLAIGGEGGLGAAIPGGIVTAVGLLLAFQNVTGAWASWSYAWALIAPGSVGATLALYGLVHGRWDLIDSGLRTAAVGLGLFIGFGLFFEYGLNVSQGEADSMKAILPALAIVAGVLIVGANLLPHPKPKTPASTPPAETTGPKPS